MNNVLFRVFCEFVHQNDPPGFWSAYEYPIAMDRDAAERLAGKWRANSAYRNVRIEKASTHTQPLDGVMLGGSAS